MLELNFFIVHQLLKSFHFKHIFSMPIKNGYMFSNCMYINRYVKEQHTFFNSCSFILQMRKMSIKRNGEIILNFPFLNFFICEMKVMQVFSVVLYPISLHILST